MSNDTPAARNPHPRLEAVLADLQVEGDELDALVSPLDAAGWRIATPAEGWDVAHQIAHLAWTDEVAVIAATDKPEWDRLVLAALGDPGGFVDAEAARGSAVEPAALLDRWRRGRQALSDTLRALPQGEKIPWFGPAMGATSMATARFMETWAHGHDIADALGVQVEPTERIRHVVHLGVRTRDFAFAAHGLEPPPEPFRVELTSPAGDSWSHGPDDARQVVRGAAYDFCLLVTQRRHHADLDLVAEGADAQRWLEVAQAFAGPPGAGRAPREVASR